ncbi:hypothetical protein [Thalassotalea hakodatensis]|uniref:hypothetical protein n=1 Tax=Thalassotalea hakodatensis TaxID=3030492 RepID=UPI00257429D8|nr:hypothetical protein [Thalassotalea hakodatensis]
MKALRLDTNIMYLASNINPTLRKRGAVAAIICSVCYIIGLFTLIYIAPDLNQLPAGRLKVIDEYGSLLYLWYFTVYGVVGLCVLFVNHALLQPLSSLPSILTILTTLVAYLSASYLFIICSIEILSNVFFLSQHYGEAAKRNELTAQIYSVLINLRTYTEWSLDVWLILVNYLLFQATKKNVYLPIFGICIGIVGILILHPLLQAYALYYVAAIATWFMLVGIQFLSSKRSFRSILHIQK